MMRRCRRVAVVWPEELDHAVDHGVQGRNSRRRTAIVLDMTFRDPARAADDVDQLDQAQVVFLGARRRLFGIAYGILRNPFEAEDIVQDAWLRWQAADRDAVVNAEAFLVTTTTRLALNDAQSAWHRRETPAGPWLPQRPESEPGPEVDVERGEAVEDTMLLLLSKLTPAERAAYLLRHAFDYPYERIAELLQFSTANCRQLVRRAGQRLASDRRRPVGLGAHKRIVEAFLAAAHDGNFADLEALLVAAVRRDARSEPRSPAETRRRLRTAEACS